MEICLIIPAYEPDQTLLGVLDGILEMQPRQTDVGLNILVVNDGSCSDISLLVFNRIKTEFPDVHLLNLENNLGKGGALKAGFQFIEKNITEVQWVVTADADGQHLPEDIWRLLNAGKNNVEFALGVRTFDTDMPFRSYVGNVLTRKLFEFINGLNISDTQTGLRGFRKKWLKKLQAIPFDGYDFEIDALTQMVKIIEPIQIPIKRVYEPGNPSSHFRPLLDSLKIYAVMLRHIMVVFSATVAEFAIYSWMVIAGVPLSMALVIGRTLATIILFWFARNFVFKSKGNYKLEALRYVTLVLINLLLLWLLIKSLKHAFGLNYIFGMVIGYCLLFFLNFLVQQYIVFRNK